MAVKPDHAFSLGPAAACRPFDAARGGFIYGESCAAVVVESASLRPGESLTRYAGCLGGAFTMDGNRNPNPSLERSGLRAADIDYVNPHGTASQVGDEIELAALRACGLDNARINATKSITGHGLSAAGAVEIVATLLQMRRERLHPTLNLQQPIDSGLRWVTGQSVSCTVRNALTLSIGFGGANSALCMQAI
jgi:malonyl-ACP decarboxylase